ncbi:phosphoenolpyruvate hydrolase family protein [Flaviflexus huanghaiensis]|uniref:phosphoenolpyruvate hydrolase family protein n=1 Tax=Flaviflexus huanghaiensis TaxID=1111473 RepID=UPI0015FD444B|nr:phosphoenolpyruvate hydrolase family protein [Flaviflexus huanghaiensis]
MAKQYTRDEVVTRLKNEINNGSPVVIVGAGTGISAKFAEKGGADLIGVYNSGKYRMDGHGSLAGLMPYGDANEIVLELGGRTVLPIVQEAPVIAGICGTDPTRQMPTFLEELKRLGFSGVMNFPTVGLIDWDSRFRQELETTGMGYEKELETLKIAKELGLFTMGYAFRPEEGAMVGEAGLDVVIAHMGLTRGGSIGSTMSKEDDLAAACRLVDEIGDAARAKNPDILVFCHGGAIAYPEDTVYAYQHSQAVGFLGASSAERIPVEGPLREATAAFKAAPLPNRI